MDKQIAIQLNDVSKTFYVRTRAANTLPSMLMNLVKRKGSLRKIEALKNINLTVSKGETLGVIGHNGSGKSTLLNVILGSIAPDNKNSIYSKGKIIRMAMGMGFDPNISGRENVMINASILGMSFKETEKIFPEIIELSGLQNYLDVPVKYYSKGMKNRLTFSIAMYAESDIYLLDEFFGGVGDVDFRERSNQIFQEKIKERKTFIIVSHSPKIIKIYAKRVIWLHQGEIKMEGKSEEVLKEYKKYFKDNKERFVGAKVKSN